MKPDNSITFIYEDKKGNCTKRTVFNFKQNEDYIEGYCQLRETLRLFKKERVKEIIKVKYSEDPEERNLVCHFINNAQTVGKLEKNEICFTEFNSGKKKELIKLAEKNGFCIRTGATNYLDFLVCGPNAGPKKIEKSKRIGAMILTEDDFLHLINSGKLPKVA